MTIRIMKPILLIIALIASSVAFAQQDDLVLANQLYSKYSFGKAIPLYEKVLSKNTIMKQRPDLLIVIEETISIRKLKNGMSV